MTPVNQTKLYSADGISAGDCYPACVASLLDIPLWMMLAVDQMYRRGLDQCKSRLNEWLDKFFDSRMASVQGHPVEASPEFYIACGPANRGVHHAVIYSRGALVHDPYPFKTGPIEVHWCEFIEKSSAPDASRMSSNN